MVLGQFVEAIPDECTIKYQNFSQEYYKNDDPEEHEFLFSRVNQIQNNLRQSIPDYYVCNSQRSQTQLRA
jgi:hypothetical protein